MNIHYITALKDNYIWLLQNQQELIVVDPGESQNVLEKIAQENLTLKAILLTHEHADHVGGLDALLAYKKVPVYGVGTMATHPLQNNEYFELFEGIICQCLFTPGHTQTSACYLVSTNEEQHLFCGDTLFSAGCGRVFTGDFQAMWHSLCKLRALNDDVLIYPGHEYTVNNLAFAQWLESENTDILINKEAALKKIAIHNNTLPVRLGTEKKINPFFRCDDPDFVKKVCQQSGKHTVSGVNTFIVVRAMKDNFNV